MTSEYDANLLTGLRKAVESLVATQAAHIERLDRFDARLDSLTREHADLLRSLATSRFEADEATQRLREIEDARGRDPDPAPFSSPRASAQKPGQGESEISEIDVAGAVAGGLAALVDAATRKREELDRYIAQLQEALATVSGTPRPMRLPVAFEDEEMREAERRGPAREIEVQVGNSGDPAALLLFEQNLRRMPGVRDVRVRTAGRDQVVFQLTMDS